MLNGGGGLKGVGVREWVERWYGRALGDGCEGRFDGAGWMYLDRACAVRGYGGLAMQMMWKDQ